MAITVGITHKVTVKVTEDLLASSVGSGLVRVFATPMMIAQMELAASECIAGELEEGQASVGTELHVAHSAASPLGVTITTTATVTAIDRRRVDFTVTASDDAGEIGAGTHTRFIVQTEKFMEKAVERAAGF